MVQSATASRPDFPNRSTVRPLSRAVFLFVFLQGMPALHAQILLPREPRATDKWLGSFGAFGGLPMGEFKEHEDGGAGAELMLGFQPWRRQPLVLRVQASGMQYGAVGAEGYQQVCDPANPSDCWIERVRYNARNHTMWVLHGGPEIMATDGTWRPFGYAVVGWTFFSSWANFKPQTPTGEEYSESLFKSRNVSTAYGVGLRRVTTRHGREGGFEFSARFTRNATASYLNEDGLQRNPDGTMTIVPRRGAANVLFLQVGWWIGPYINWNER